MFDTLMPTEDHSLPPQRESAVHHKRGSLQAVLLTRILATLVSLLASLLMAEWMLATAGLLARHPSCGPLDYYAALAFLASGLGLVFITFSYHRFARFCASLIVGFGLANLLQYGLNFHPGFFTPPLQILGSSLGHSSPNTALCFLLVGTALFLMAKAVAWEKWRLAIIELLGTLGTPLAIAAFNHHLEEAENPEPWQAVARMPAHAALSFIALSIALLSYCWHKEQQRETGIPPNSPWLLGIGFSFMVLLLWQALTTWEAERVQAARRADINYLRQQLFTAIQHRLNNMVRMAARLEWEEVSKPFWQADASLVIEQDPSFQGIAWLDASLHAHWIVPLKLKKQEAKEEVELTAMRQKEDAFYQAARTGEGQLTHHRLLAIKEKSFFIVIAAERSQEDKGFLVGAVGLPSFIESVFKKQLEAGYAIELFADDTLLYTSQAKYPSSHSLLPHQNVEIRLAGARWRLSISLPATLAIGGQNYIPLVVLTVGLLFTLVAAISLHLARQTQLKNVALEENVFKLKQAREQFEKLIQAIPEPMIIFDSKGRIILANIQTEHTFGYACAELIGKTIELLFTERLRPSFLAYCQQSLAKTSNQNPISLQLECLGQRKDRMEFPLEISLSLLSRDDKQLILASLRDITERKHFEEELYAKEHQLKYFVEHSPAAVVILDKDLRYLVSSDSWFSEYNILLTRAQIYGHSLYEIFADLPNYWTKVFTHCIAGHVEKSEATAWPRKDGSITWIRWEIHPWYDAHNEIGGIFIFSENITTRKTTEQELEKAIAELSQARKAAELANQAKSDFLASMSHEIRTPLGIILGYSDMLIHENYDPLNQRIFAETIQRNSQHLLALVNDILDLSKVEAGKLEIETRPLPVLPFLSELKEQMGLQAQAKALEFTLNVHGSLPSIIRTDEIKLRQILVNIIGNAIKFTNHGKVMVEVSMDPSDSGSASENLLFTVRDTGCGIAEENQEKVFQPFTQAEHYVTRQYGGTGLGLGLSRKLAHLLGGDLTLEQSLLGQGSVFAIRIAVNRVDTEAWLDADSCQNLLQQPLTPARLPQHRKTLEQPLTGLHLLLVEDFEDNQNLMRVVLKAAGAKITIANNGLEAVQKALAEHYDLVLMDMQMPIMNGYEATAVLREHAYEKPIIALTAHAMKGELERCIAAGCDGYLSKPIQKEKLIHEIIRHSTNLPLVSKPLASELSPPAGLGIKQGSLQNGKKAGASAAFFTPLARDHPLYEVTATIIARLPEHVSQFRKHLQEKDWLALSVRAHQLKGLGGSIGLEQVSVLSSSLEEEAKKSPQDPKQLYLLIEEFALFVEKLAAG